MAKPVTVRYGKFVVSLSDGADPAGFTAPCGFTSKSFTRNKTLGETQIPDCTNPDASGWVERDAQAMSATISGSGVLAKSALPLWEAAYASDESVECEVEFIYPDGDADVYTGRFHVESLEVTGAMGERVQISVTMQSDGEIEYERTLAPDP